MKTTITVLLILVATIAQGQLKGNAMYIKKAFPAAYESKLKRYAVEEWGGNHRMVVYEINRQADALTELCRQFKTDNTKEFIAAIKEWGLSGFENHNLQELQSIEEVSRKALLRFHCDWKMVLYEYERQTKAKSSY